MTLFERVEKIEADISALQANSSSATADDIAKLQAAVSSLRSDVGFPSVPPSA